jgi:Type II secretion system (T2SS), protein G
MELTNSKRLLYTASYVSTKLEDPHKATPSGSGTSTAPGVHSGSGSPVHVPDSSPRISRPIRWGGDAFVKANILRSMEFKSENLGQILKLVQDQGTAEYKGDMEKLLTIIQRLNNTLRPVSTLEIAPLIAPIPFDAFTQLAELAAPIESNFVTKLPLIIFFVDRNKEILPIGRIHLERIEMYPAGTEKGELVFSVPMAPGETTTISHKEWTTTSREFEDIVQDFFESYSERGVADKTDASMASESESKHSSSFDFGASLSGEYMGVTLTTTLGIKDTNDERESVKQSIQKHREVTEKASARTRKEHKVSMKYETKTGTEDVSGKTITNPGKTAIRIDYYRMMRKWRTDLYRYGLRLTYDIAIPLPGVRLWALHEHVAALDKEIRLPFTFTLKADDINVNNWRDKAKEFGATPEVVSPPPEDEIHISLPDTIIGYQDRQDWGPRIYGKIDFEVKNGYTLNKAKATAICTFYGGAVFIWHKGSDVITNQTGEDITITGDLKDLYGLSGAMSASYYHHDLANGTLLLDLWFKVTDETIKAWKTASWTAIKASAEARYHEEIARKQEERDKLWRLLNGKDTLTLRRLEREELLRLVMQWLLGPDNPLASNLSVQETLSKMLDNERAFQEHQSLVSFLDPSHDPTSLNPTFTGLDKNAASGAVMFGEQVKFIHQAIEWENLLYFLYPYFWGSEVVGRDKMLFEHADPEHERFLRAGYVRIVVPVRPGFEHDFTNLIRTGTLASHEDQDHPYVKIADDIANFAHTNYAGIPPANPEKHARPLLYPEQRTTWDTMQKIIMALDKYKENHNKYPSTLEELKTEPNSAITSENLLDAWGNPFEYKTPGLSGEYDLISWGRNHCKDGDVAGEGLDADISAAAGASLVATWFDYTPTSALDIEVVTKSEVIA